MARTKKELSPVTRQEIAEAAALLSSIVSTLESAANSLSADEHLDVEYAKSLEQGMDRLRTVEKNIREALILHQADIMRPHRKELPSVPGANVTTAEQLQLAEDRQNRENEAEKVARDAAPKRKPKASTSKRKQA